MSDEVSLAEMLASVSKENDLSGLNVVDKIKDELKKKSEVAYQKWEENQFNINHLFTVKEG
ncbi:hypothetical protein [Wolbachia endosymbiont of Tettigetta isshikii]|uniref:hypothetical protein n=1 Tax=Wolbachia endosymbiont of Tettigetta isshikii TaxID=3239093 RepID=UPI00398048D8